MASNLAAEQMLNGGGECLEQWQGQWEWRQWQMAGVVMAVVVLAVMVLAVVVRAVVVAVVVWQPW